MRAWIGLVFALPLFGAPAWSNPITVKGRYFEFATRACPGASDCSLINQFSAVPAGSQLIITQASCIITSTGSARIQQVFLAAKLVAANAPVRIHYLVPTLVANAAGGRQYALNQQVLEPLQSKETPFVSAVFDQTTTISMACSLAGELIP